MLERFWQAVFLTICFNLLLHLHPQSVESSPSVLARLQAEMRNPTVEQPGVFDSLPNAPKN